MVVIAFVRKVRQSEQGNDRLYKGSEMGLYSVRKSMSLRNMKDFQHLEGASQDACKHYGSHMILNIFLRKGFQSDQERICFIRFWGVVSPM